MVADALSRKTSLLATSKVKVVGFDLFHEKYVNEADFAQMLKIVQIVHMVIICYMTTFSFEVRSFVFLIVLYEITLSWGYMPAD
jgi:uncharacterized membrane protein